MSSARSAAAPLVGLFSTFLYLTPAYAAVSCRALPNDFEFCTAGTVWHDAENFAFEGAVILEREDLWLEVMPLPEEMTNQPLDAMMDSLASEYAHQALEEGARAPENLNRESFQTTQIDAVMLTMTEFENGGEYVVVTAVLQANDRHIILALDGDAAYSASEMEQNMRKIAELIRPTEEG